MVLTDDIFFIILEIFKIKVQNRLMLIPKKILEKKFFLRKLYEKIVKSRQISWCDSFFSTMIISLFSNRKYFLIVCRMEKDSIDLNQCLPSPVWYHWEMHWAWRSKALPTDISVWTFLQNLPFRRIGTDKEFFVVKFAEIRQKNVRKYVNLTIFPEWWL